MEKVKGFFSGTLAIILWLAGIIISVLILVFGVYISQIINPILDTISTVGTIVCIFILLPLSIFKKTRTISCYGLMIASWIFGANLWVFSFLITYFYWGFWGVFLGLFLLNGTGVAPIALIASVFHSNWSYVGNIIYLCVLTFGSRFLSIYLAGKIDEEAYLKENLKQDETFIEGEEIKEITDSEPEYIWVCDYCGEEFDSEFSADKHEKICKSNPKNMTPDDEPEYTWVCDYCNEEFSSKLKADKHEKICNLDPKNNKITGKIFCTKCGTENFNDFNFCKKCGNKIII